MLASHRYLDDLLDAVDGVRQQAPDLVIIVHVVRVADAHEEDVGRETRQLLGSYARPQI